MRKDLQGIFKNNAIRCASEVTHGASLDIEKFIRWAIEDCSGPAITIDEAESLIRIWLDHFKGWWPPINADYYVLHLGRELYRHCLTNQDAPVVTEKTALGRGRPKSSLLETRHRVIRKVSEQGLKGEDYCKELTKLSLSTPLEWQRRDGCPPSYIEAFHHPDKRFRKRIFHEKNEAASPQN